MPQETEIKFKVDDLRTTERRLQALGASYLGAVFQTDAYFDTPRKRLLAADSGLRLRTARCIKAGVEPMKAGALLTFKGPARRGGKAKVRSEYQTRVDDPTAAAEILAACGLRPMLTIQKRRASYRLGRCRVELDRLPMLGCFVEIEAPGEGAILALAAKLGLRGEPIKTHYVNLLQARCKRIGRGCNTAGLVRCDRQCRRYGSPRI
jgi:predicted adenylyl cyclase CyaB